MGINIGLDIGSVSLKARCHWDAGRRATVSDSYRRTGYLFCETSFRIRARMRAAPWYCPATAASTAAPFSPPSICSASSTRKCRRERRRHSRHRLRQPAHRQNSGHYFENEFRAVAKGMRVFYPDVRTVFEMGGESSNTSSLNLRQPGGWELRLLNQRRLRRGHRLLHRSTGFPPALLRRRSRASGLRSQLCRTHRRTLLRLRQVRHDSRPAEGLLHRPDSSRALRRRCPELQVLIVKGRRCFHPSPSSAGSRKTRQSASRCTGIQARRRRASSFRNSTPGLARSARHVRIRGEPQAIFKRIHRLQQHRAAEKSHSSTVSPSPWTNVVLLRRPA